MPSAYKSLLFARVRVSLRKRPALCQPFVNGALCGHILPTADFGHAVPPCQHLADAFFKLMPVVVHGFPLLKLLKNTNSGKTSARARARKRLPFFMGSQNSIHTRARARNAHEIHPPRFQTAFVGGLPSLPKQHSPAGWRPCRAGRMRPYQTGQPCAPDSPCRCRLGRRYGLPSVSAGISLPCPACRAPAA